MEFEDLDGVEAPNYETAVEEHVQKDTVCTSAFSDQNYDLSMTGFSDGSYLFSYTVLDTDAQNQQDFVLKFKNWNAVLNWLDWEEQDEPNYAVRSVLSDIEADYQIDTDKNYSYITQEKLRSIYKGSKVDSILKILDSFAVSFESGKIAYIGPMNRILFKDIDQFTSWCADTGLIADEDGLSALKEELA